MQISRTTIKRIEQLERMRAELVRSVVRTGEMIQGSFSTVYRKCGKPNCRCARGKGYPVDQIVFMEGLRPKCRVVPKEDVPWVRSMTGEVPGGAGGN